MEDKKSYTQPQKKVWCVGTWPEDNYADFLVCDVREGETEEEAIARAKLLYSPDDKFYIMKDRRRHE
jgi:hypothetical protein